MPEYPRSHFKKTGTSITPNVDGDSLDATVIGRTTPAAGIFTSLKGNISEIIQSTSDTLTASELRGMQISNYGQGASDNLQQLPSAAEGMSFIALCGTAQAANYFRFQAAASDKIYLEGAAGSDNGYVSIMAPIVGAAIAFFTFQTGSTSWDWFANTIYGTWIAG